MQEIPAANTPFSRTMEWEVRKRDKEFIGKIMMTDWTEFLTSNPIHVGNNGNTHVPILLFAPVSCLLCGTIFVINSPQHEPRNLALKRINIFIIVLISRTMLSKACAYANSLSSWSSPAI